MICDSTTRILNVCIYPGSVHDSFIWNYSHAKEEMKTTYENGLGRFFLLGDAGYALEPWLLTPLPNALPGTPEFSYTEAHCKTRSVVERLFGILKARWRCLLRDRVLHYQPAQASKIILTCAVLHNINLFHQIPLPEDEAIMEEGENINLDVEELDEPVAGDRLQIARRIQGGIIFQYFN
ncbi:putative nuclease HARBI1 [Ischnura elegans]|uniref:putative nuclease HARBI1 n=1 Tax=Ischnura elegans TaxID=197161 RepID=UPI001ED87F97|nr:putative nuclease HARBI1 [Ischnura elegans]XP_046392801.1 putative nuclease HARBI1 [Ischnura elegans]XP_046392802.1 putative nuclease HARBI1 [Ischnura elegans]XP_046401093.1 putative nuclease HARBI1 [Ischnura elegans]